MNIWAHHTDFGSAEVQYCARTSVLSHDAREQGAIQWGQTTPFSDLPDLIERLRAIVGDSQRIRNLGIKCHGLPGQLAMAGEDSPTVNTTTLTTDGPRFQQIHALLDRSGGNRPLVIFQSCFAAQAPAGTALFTAISGNYLRNTRVVGFTVQLVATPHRRLPRGTLEGGGFGSCLPPSDLRVTRITDPGSPDSTPDYLLRSLPFATPSARSTREFLNGREVRTGLPASGTRRSGRSYRLTGPNRYAGFRTGRPLGSA